MALPRDIDTKYANAFDIFCQIGSTWGITQCFLSEALLYHTTADEFPDKYADTADKLVQAEKFSRNLGLVPDLALIQHIKSHAPVAFEPPSPRLFIIPLASRFIPQNMPLPGHSTGKLR